MTVRSLESVHRLRYFRFCNVLHIWTIRAIPTYRDTTYVPIQLNTVDNCILFVYSNWLNVVKLYTVMKSQE